MSWEKRKSKFYYYRVRRDRNGRLKKTYFHSGRAAQRAYEEDLQRRKEQEQARQEKAHLTALDDQNKKLTNVTKTLTKASLLGAGFHQHKRQWRKRRNIENIYQQGENDMQNNTLTLETRSYDALEDLVSQAQEGNTSALPAIRELLDLVPEIWQDSRVLANRVERSWMTTLCGRDLVSQEVIEREVQALRTQLQGQNPSPLETLLVDRICTCWLAVQHAELQAGKRLNAHRFALNSAEENRLDKVHRRFLMAIRELARVRKLLTPEQRLQVNVGHNQIVA